MKKMGRALFVGSAAIAAGLALQRPAPAGATNADYHNAGVNGAPQIGNWAWVNAPHPALRRSNDHIWWMKQHWMTRGDLSNVHNTDGFEMEWFDGGHKDNCDVFDIESGSRVYIGSPAVVRAVIKSDCGGGRREQVDFLITDHNRIPAASEGGGWPGLSWAVVGTVPAGPVVCTDPPPGQPSCGLPESHEVNLEWRRGNVWLGKMYLSRCPDPRYHAVGTDPAGLARDTSC